MSGQKRIYPILVLLLLATGACRKDKPINVGSKTGTEDAILAEIAAQHIEDRLHRPVVRKFNVGGTGIINEAIGTNEVDVYPEYSGIAQTFILRVSVMPDPQSVFERVRDMYKTNLGLDWLPPLGYQSPRVMVIRKEDADKYDLKTLSDAEKRGNGWALGVSYEFQQRPDGASAMNRSYHLITAVSPVVMDTPHLYQALEQRQVSMISGALTDGFLDPARFTALRDDRDAFPPYQPSFVVRLPVETQFPGLREALLELSGRISIESIRDMNRSVDIGHSTPAEVATRFLQSAGLR